MAYQNEIVFDVRYCETDRMGIVHHSRYYPWFEMGRCAFMEEAGFPYAKMEQSGLLVPLTQSHARYHEGAKFGDKILLKTSLSKLGGARCQFSYLVYRQSDGVLLTEGYTEHAFVDENFHPINAKKKYADMWMALNNLLDQAEAQR